MTPEELQEEQAESASGEDSAFAGLSRRTQIKIMRQVADAALAAYHLPPVRLVLLAHSWNTVFRVDSPGGQSYVLRINRWGTRTVQTVGSELAWLTALRRDTSLQVPEPVPTRTGQPLTLVDTFSRRPRICVLFRWVAGHRVWDRLTPRHLEQVGEFIAHLQNHGRQWQRPPGFKRGRVDWPIEAGKWLDDPLSPEIISYIDQLVADTLSAEEATEVTMTLARVREVEQALGRGPDVFGLMHADLHYHNVLYLGGELRALDFDDCGFGYYMFDPAVTLNELMGRTDYPALKAALLEGYRTVTPLSAEHEGYIDTFLALRKVQDALWILEVRKHPFIEVDWRMQARRSLAHLKTFLAGESFR